MLNFIFGASGSGKTDYVIKRLEDMSHSADTPLFLIVPEQSSHTTEKKLLQDLGEQFSRKINVVTFKRMSDLIMQKTGGIAGRRVSDGEKNILMSRAISLCADELGAYKSKAIYPELVSLMLKTAERLKLCMVSSQMLFDASEEINDDMLKSKINDVALIFEKYNSLLNESYSDPSDDLEKLSVKLSQNDFFKDAVIFIDGFSGFTKAEYDIICNMLVQSKDCYISLCYEEENSDSEKFALTHDTYQSLIRICNRAKSTVGQKIKLTSGKRFVAPELKILEKNIFTNDKTTTDIQIDKISIINTKNIYDECNYVAAKIKELVFSGEYRYKDIVLISRSCENYQGVLDITLEKYGIPYFMDNTQSIDSQPLMLALQSVIDAACSSANIDAFMRVYKSGLTSIDYEDVSLFENYILMWNIKGSRLYREFTENPMGFGREENDKSRELLNKINDIRERMTAPISFFKKASKGKNAVEISRALYKYIEKAGIKERLIEVISEYESKNDHYHAMLLERLWSIMMESLDYIAFACDKEPMTLKRYGELLKLVINSGDIGSIPKGFDTVTFGTSDRIRPDSPKVVFLLGVNEDEFPMPPKHDGLFSRLECDVLSDYGVELYDNPQKLTAMETFFSYTAAVSPSERLYMLYNNGNLSGEEKRPSVIITETLKIFKNIRITSTDECNESELLWAKEPSFEVYAKSQPYGRVSSTLRKYFEEDDVYAKKLSAVDKARRKDIITISDKSIAEKLFKKDMYVSPSQIEKYHHCPFSYFCLYGIKAKERKKAELNYIEYGSLVHGILEKFFIDKSYANVEMSFSDIKDIVKKLTDEYVAKFMGGYDDKSPRFKYLCENLVDRVTQLVIQLMEEFAQSEFKPDAFEMQISSDDEIKPYRLEMSNGKTINVIGKIDRVDTFREDGKTYVRVIDYKTGGKKFVKADIVHGLNMQMLLYLSTINANGEKKYGTVVPSGVLYMPAAVSNINVSPDTGDDEAQRIVSESLQMNGLLIDDYNVLQAMEKALEGRFIPVVLKGMTDDNIPEYSGKNSLVPAEELEEIFRSIDVTLIEMGESLQNGGIDVLPIKGKYDACSYCAFRSVCGYEEGDRCKKISK
ncbi:MAG: PD-(D/E)XK nuclease family protein [Clostridia bacterium]|nr:PD-(D/E)XK nuclease family protein [Clostridia bacterium]